MVVVVVLVIDDFTIVGVTAAVIVCVMTTDPFTRTVTEMDNILFTSLTMNVQPLHLDEEFAKTTVHGQRVFNSLFTMALIGGFTVPDTTFGTTLGNLGYEKVEFDYVGASSHWTDVRKAVDRTWVTKAGSREPNEFLLLDSKGLLDQRRFETMQKTRDRRRVSLHE